MLPYFLQRIRNRLSAPLGHRLLSRKENDTFIAAYPRSGSTWLRTILTNILVPDANSDPDVFNSTIPAVSIKNAGVINQLAAPRLIMTHSCRRAELAKAVYLLRDGRDALISSYHYHVTRNEISMSIDQYYRLYRSRVFGPTWGDNVNSWMSADDRFQNNQVLVVGFEAMKENTHESITTICDYIGIDCNEEGISNAIQQASIVNVKKIEQQRDGNIIDENASFYRGGHTNQWEQNAEYKAVIESFEKDENRALTLAGILNAH